MDENLACYIDHTLLKPEATRQDITGLCLEAAELGFYSVCLNPSYVAAAAEELREREVKVCAVVGFPLGASTTAVKAFETVEAIKNGADEIDMVIHIGALKEGRKDYVRDDIKAVVRAAEGRPVKVIIETCLLTTEEKVLACNLAREAGAAFVKTSTGFSTGGATVDDVRLMRETVGPEMGIKASGGVRTPETAREMIKAGATRIGASAGAAILGR